MRLRPALKAHREGALVVGRDHAAHSLHTGCPAASLASWLRWWTRKHRVQTNSSACLGTTAMVSSSPDRSAPGSSNSSAAMRSSSSIVAAWSPARRARAPRGSRHRDRPRSCGARRSRWPRRTLSRAVVAGAAGRDEASCCARRSSVSSSRAWSRPWISRSLRRPPMCCRTRRLAVLVARDEVGAVRGQRRPHGVCGPRALDASGRARRRLPWDRLFSTTVLVLTPGPAEDARADGGRQT